MTKTEQLRRIIAPSTEARGIVVEIYGGVALVQYRGGTLSAPDDGYRVGDAVRISGGVVFGRVTPPRRVVVV